MLHLQAPTFIAHYPSVHIVTWNHGSKYIGCPPGSPWTASSKSKASLWDYGEQIPFGKHLLHIIGKWCCWHSQGLSSLHDTSLHNYVINIYDRKTLKTCCHNWAHCMESASLKLLQGCISGTNCRAPERKVVAFVAERHREQRIWVWPNSDHQFETSCALNVWNLEHLSQRPLPQKYFPEYSSSCKMCTQTSQVQMCQCFIFMHSHYALRGPPPNVFCETPGSKFFRWSTCYGTPVLGLG